MDNKSSILIVEDEAILAEALRLRLETFGYSVVGIAGTAAEAISLSRGHVPDLVLMDINLPGASNGIEAGRDIRRTLDVPVVFLTAYADESTVERAKAAEPFGYLAKPVTTENLRTTVEIALHKNKLEKELRRRERWLASTVANMHEALVAVDSRGAIVLMNPVAVELTGWTNIEAAGRSLEEIVPLIDTSGANAASREFGDRAETRLPAGLVCLHRSGKPRRVSGYATPIWDEEDFKGMMFIFHPVESVGSPKRVVDGRELATICAWCKRGKMDEESWLDLDAFLEARFRVALSHGICPTCSDQVFPGGRKSKSPS